MAKKKIEYNYKDGGSTYEQCCSICDHYISSFPVNDYEHRTYNFEPRCKIIGPYDGKEFRIHPAGICNKFSDCLYQERMKKIWVW